MGSENGKKHVLITLVGKNEPSPMSELPKIHKIKRWNEPSTSWELGRNCKLVRRYAFCAPEIVPIDPEAEHAEPEIELVEPELAETDRGDHTEASYDRGGSVYRRIWKKSGMRTYYQPANEGNILTFCREKEPDIVFMFPTGAEAIDDKSEQTESHAEHVKAVLGDIHPNIECCILPLKVDSVKNVEATYSRFRDQFREMLNKLDELAGGLDKCRFSLITSIGAPDMRTAVKEYISTTSIDPKYFSILLPKDKKEDGSRVEEVPQNIERAADLLKDMDDDIENFRFDVLARNMKEISKLSVLSERKELANIFVDIFKAYSDMERMDYREAFKKINDRHKALGEHIEKMHSMPGDIHDIADKLMGALGRQRDYIRKITDLGIQKMRYGKREYIYESVENLVDLFYNMKRAFKRRNYADVLSRFWRFWEGALNFRLRNIGVDVRNLDKGNENVNKLIQAKLLLPNANYYDGNIDGRMDMLKKLHDEKVFKLYIDYCQKEHKDADGKIVPEGRLVTLRHKRNDTIVAHGMLPVSEAEAQTCCGIGQSMICDERYLLLGAEGWQMMTDYPFKAEDTQLFSEILKNI